MATQDLLENSSKLISLGSAALVALSVCYDAAFLNSLGLSFAELPTGIGDHVRSAVIWAPIVAATLIFVALVGIGHADINADLRARGRRFSILNIVFTALAIGTCLDLVLQGTGLQLYLLLGMLLAFAIFWDPTVMLRGAIPVHRSRQILFVILGFAAVAWLGAANGRALAAAKSPKWILHTELGDARSEILAKGIRRFSAVLVVVDADRKVQVIPNEKVLDARSVDPTPPSAMCRFARLNCD